MLRAAAVGWCLVTVATARSAVGQESITFEELMRRMPPEVAAEIEGRVSPAQRVAPPDEAARNAALDELRTKSVAIQPSKPATVTGNASTAARCISGYVAEGHYNVSAADVRVVAERKLDCDAAGCRSFQVTTSRSSPEPYQIEVSVTCSG
jgi:hypothetical protein